MTNGFMPPDAFYAVPGSGRVVGDVLTVEPRGMNEALGILDALEGYSGEGRPIVRAPVGQSDDRTRRAADIGLPAGINAVRLSPSQVIPTADWCDVAGPA
jgi:gamma-glutamylcyclotransferase (GGCT)/AIG2-like uncharacterized protein YtfP